MQRLLERGDERGSSLLPRGRGRGGQGLCHGLGLAAAVAAVLGRAEPGDFVYFDPPYVPLSATSSFVSYTAGGFGMPEQARLRDTARALKDRGVHVLLSNSSAPAVHELYQEGFTRTPVAASRAINCDASKRGAVMELLLA